MIETVENGHDLRVPALEEVSNSAEDLLLPPYRVELEIEGTVPILFHRWNCEAVEEKANAAKGSKAKKSDNVDSYVYRADNGNLGLPGEYLRQACCWAAKFRQDPRSPRKSAMDLYKAGLICETEVADLGQKKWDYVDQRRVVIQRSGITRQRPALEKGWKATFHFTILVPQYIAPNDFHSVISNAGLLVGVGDFRPTYGRFMLVRYELLPGL
jgi:hypothetical protein